MGMGTRRKSRILALQALYQSEINRLGPLDRFPLLCENFEVSRKAVPYGARLVEGIAQNWEKLNRMIADCARNWRLERMALIDRNIIRIAAYEIIFEGVPHEVAINEAVEIAKVYCADDSVAFINGVLDAVQRNIESVKDERAAI